MLALAAATLGLSVPALAPRARRVLSTTAPIPEGTAPPPEAGWFDGKLVGSCVVKRFNDEIHGDRWFMWYSGRPEGFREDAVPIATGCVGLAQSKDGIVWERLAGDEPGGSCLAPNDESPWAFDTTHVGVGDVHLPERVQSKAGPYRMYYFGGDANEPPQGSPAPAGIVGTAMSIGVALSNDGVHWERVEGSYASGAVLEPKKGQLFVGWPQVIMTSVEPEASGAWRMYYHALNIETMRFEIGLATSDDGMVWEHAEESALTPGRDGAFDSGSVSARCVVREPAASGGGGSDHGGWLMFYEAQDAARRHTIGLARSSDGVSWVRGDAPVFEPSDVSGAWDGTAVSRPWVVPLEDGSAMLYYLGRGEAPADGSAPSQGIGVARSDGTDWTKWVRVCSAATL